MNLQDIKARFPGVSSVGTDMIARVNGEAVVVANYINGAFILTQKGQVLQSEPTAEKPTTRRGRPAKEKVEEVVEPQPEEVSLEVAVSE